MADLAPRKSELWKGVRRGVGWTAGVGTVLTAAAVLRDGPRPALKAVLKAALRGREVAAEVGEQVRDLYAEAQSEHAAAPPDA